MRKRTLSLIIVFVLGMIFLPLDSQAGFPRYGLDITGSNIGYNIGKDNPQASIFGSVGLVAGTALSALGILFLVLMLYAGIRWMTAQGNEESVKKAKEIIIAAAIGLVLVLSSYAIASFVLSKMGVQTGESTPDSPSAAIGCCHTTIQQSGYTEQQTFCTQTVYSNCSHPLQQMWDEDDPNCMSPLCPSTSP